MAPATARQIEYAMALGVDIPARCNKESMSPLIDAGVKRLKRPPNSRQLQLAKQFDIAFTTPPKTSEDLVSVLYEHLKARRWVYSVIRHSVQADWKRYSESGLPESFANQIASTLKKDAKLMAKVEKREGGNHASGGDVWYRITDKGVNSPEYLFVKNYELPDKVVAEMKAKHRKQAKGGGCLSILSMVGLAGVVLIALLLLID